MLIESNQAYLLVYFFSFPQDIYKSIADTLDQNDLYLLLLQIFHAHLPDIVNTIEMYPYKNKPYDRKLFFVASGVVKNSFGAVFVWKVTQISSSFPPNCSSYFEHDAFNNSVSLLNIFDAAVRRKAWVSNILSTS